MDDREVRRKVRELRTFPWNIPCWAQRTKRNVPLLEEARYLLNQLAMHIECSILIPMVFKTSFPAMI